MFPTNGTSHLTISTTRPKEKSHIILVVDNTTVQIARIFVMRPRSRRPRRSAQIVRAVVDTVVDTAMDGVVDSKMST